jgi:mono/diheme cytochrome c family protein
MAKFLGLFCITAIIGFAQDSSAVARGKYLVEEVAKCSECHTPRTEAGELDSTKWLKGAVLDVQPIHETKGWHKTSPDLTSTGRLFARWAKLDWRSSSRPDLGLAAMQPILRCRLTNFSPMTRNR